MKDTEKLAGVNENAKILFVCNTDREFENECLNYPESRIIQKYMISDMAAEFFKNHGQHISDKPYLYNPCFTIDDIDGEKIICSSSECITVFHEGFPIVYRKWEHRPSGEALAIRLENGNVMEFGEDDVYADHFYRAGVLNPSEKFESIGRYDLHRVADCVGDMMSERFSAFAYIFPEKECYLWDSFTEWYNIGRNPLDYFDHLLGEFDNALEALGYFKRVACPEELEKLGQWGENSLGYSPLYGLEKIGNCYFVAKGIKKVEE